MATVQVQPDDGSPQAAVAVGYQQPKVKFHPLDNETVSRILANDPGIAGLHLSTSQVTNADYADQVGRAISRSIHLRTLEIRGVLEDTNGFHSLFIWLAHNRSIASFVSSPHSLSKTPTSVVLICIGPKIINLHRNNIGDTKAAGLINALNAMPGLHNLLELDLGENDIGRKGFEAL